MAEQAPLVDPASPDRRPDGYPAELESDVLLADGRVALVRPIVPGDTAALRAFDEQLSPETVYMRFFGPRGPLSDTQVERFVTVNYHDRLALVAFVGGELVAVARYDRTPGGPEAEVAFVVRDDQQGRGLATVLLEHLASAASALGIRRFVADTLTQNNKMLRVFREAGFEEHASFEAGVVRVVMSLEATPAYARSVEERNRLATVRSLQPLLRPASIAVVGASHREKTIGHELLTNLLADGFAGPIYPVNSGGGEIAGLKAYRSVEDLPERVDLAVIAVPAAGVATVVEQCGLKGVGGLVVISAGFAESGGDGRLAERRLVSLARRYGMRLVGPNCMGILNTSPEISMNATFAQTPPVFGHIAFSSQSGGLGIAILEEATNRDLGVSTFVSVGNRADVSGNDLLYYWEEDPETAVILLYLESFGDPRHFASIARRVAREKPIVAVKSGRSGSGARGASSHTAAMATADATVDALFHQAGVIRVDTLEELFDVADVLSHQPLPAGSGVAIVGNAGGPGVLAADACEGHGLDVPELSAETQRRLRAVLSPQAAVRNPVDCIASATAADYRAALDIVLDDEAVDAVIVIFTPPLVTEADDVAAVVTSVAATATKPILANFLTTSTTLSRLREGGSRVPWFEYPETAAAALARIRPYAAWRAKPETSPPVYTDVDVHGGRVVVDIALATVTAPATAGTWLDIEATTELLAAYRIPFVASVRAESTTAAVEAATAAGFPVAVKVDVPGVVHKTDVGGVRLGLASAEEVSVVAGELLTSFGPGAAVVVQPMVPGGIETIVGIVEDPLFGPLLMFGLGGTATEVLGDRALSLVPLSLAEATEMITSLRSSRLLLGYRGAPAADLTALAELICRVARLAEDLPEVVEMDLNPVIAGEHSCLALDAKVRVAKQLSPQPALRRRHLG